MDDGWERTTKWRAPRAGFFPPRSLRQIMTVVALSGLTMAVVLPRGGPAPASGPARFRTRPVPGPRSRPARVPPPGPARVHPMVVAAPEGIDPGIVVAAPADLDPRMVVPPGAPRRR